MLGCRFVRSAYTEHAFNTVLVEFTLLHLYTIMIYNCCTEENRFLFYYTSSSQGFFFSLFCAVSGSFTATVISGLLIIVTLYTPIMTSLLGDNV